MWEIESEWVWEGESEWVWEGERVSGCGRESECESECGRE